MDEAMCNRGADFGIIVIIVGMPKYIHSEIRATTNSKPGNGIDVAYLAPKRYGLVVFLVDLQI